MAAAGTENGASAGHFHTFLESLQPPAQPALVAICQVGSTQQQQHRQPEDQPTSELQAFYAQEPANQNSANTHKPANHSTQKLWAAEPSRSYQKQLKAAV